MAFPNSWQAEAVAWRSTISSLTPPLKDLKHSTWADARPSCIASSALGEIVGWLAACQGLVCSHHSPGLVASSDVREGSPVTGAACVHADPDITSKTPIPRACIVDTAPCYRPRRRICHSRARTRPTKVGVDRFFFFVVVYNKICLLSFRYNY